MAGRREPWPQVHPGWRRTRATQNMNATGEEDAGQNCVGRSGADTILKPIEPPSPSPCESICPRACVPDDNIGSPRHDCDWGGRRETPLQTSLCQHTWLSLAVATSHTLFTLGMLFSACSSTHFCPCSAARSRCRARASGRERPPPHSCARRSSSTLAPSCPKQGRRPLPC